MPSNNQYGEWYHTTSQPEDWTHDYEVYTIQNPGDNSEILKICVRKVGNLREGYQYEYTEPQIPVKISRYLHDTSRLSKIKGNVQDNRYGVGGNTYNWGGYYWYKQSDTSEKYTEDNYKAHLDKFNNYNLEIRIHPDYEDKYKFGMGTKDNNPTSTNVFTHWYFNRLLQLPIHETQFQNGTDPSDGLLEIHSFFKLNSMYTHEMRTYPNKDMDYLYFYTADNSKTRQSKVSSEFIFKANWAEIVTKIHEDPKCYLYDNDRNECATRTTNGFKGGNESMCIYQPKVHCKGEWKDPPTVVDDYGNNVANTCGLVQSGVKIKQYVELSASKLDAINDVWNPGNYKSIIGAQCDDEDIGWLVYQDLDASKSGQVATDTFRTKKLKNGIDDNPKYDPTRKLPQGITGTPAKGTWKRAAPKHGDLKYEACSTPCVEADVNTACEKNVSGDYDERNRMRIPPDYDSNNTYDFGNAWDAAKNNCSGNFTTYKTIAKYAQGADPETKCPNFTLEQSRGNPDEIHKRNYSEEFVRGGACTLPKQYCIAGSSCIVNTDKIEELVTRINQTPKSREDQLNTWTATGSNGAFDLLDDNTLKLTIDGTTYSHENKITKEILFRLAKKECDRFGDSYGSILDKEKRKPFCTEEKRIYVSETPGVPPCEFKQGSCYSTSTSFRPGIKVSSRSKIGKVTEVNYTNRYYKWSIDRISHTSFCKWIDMPDPPSE